jgi:signal transduction histidine kinase
MSVRVRDPQWRATAVAGGAMLLGLALALARSSAAVAITAALAGLVVAAFVLAPRAGRALHRQPSLLLVLVPVVVVATAFVLRLLALADSLPPALEALRVPWIAARTSLLPVTVMTLAAVGGLVLIADAVRLRLGLGRQSAPWHDITASGPSAPPSPAPWRVVIGVLLVGWAAFLGLGLGGSYLSRDPGLLLVLFLVVAIGAATVIGTPLLIAALARRDQTQTAGAWEQERRRFAAHLHDSVLQTLALVQRQAHDPSAVARLARRQEHALRAWMAGESDLLRETLAGALRDVVAEVEDEAGAAVETSIIGDRALDERGQALVGAARETLRNAARHGAGAPIFVFAQITPEAVEVFVRDEGPGFDQAAVPAERRGLRDAVVGRMESAGGSATIESAPGEGTEVALRLGGRR